MKRILFITAFIITAALIQPTFTAQAYEHAYDRETDFIYACSRHGMTVYDSPGGSVTGFIPDFEGAVAIGEDGGWYEVKYRLKRKTHYGWVTKDEFNGSGLEYDGRDKQVLADGRYRVIMMTSQPDHKNLFGQNQPGEKVFFNKNDLYSLTYAGDNAFLIRNDRSKQYLTVLHDPEHLKLSAGPEEPLTIKNDESSYISFGSKEGAGHFVIIRDGNCFRIMDQNTLKYLYQDEDGIMRLSSDIRHSATFRFYRTRKAIQKHVLRNFCQYDPDWAHYHYGIGEKKKVEHGNYSTSGCGILAAFNAIYGVTGVLPDVFEMGKYASEEHFRIEGAGTDSSFFYACAARFGYKYGFRYDGSSDSFEDLEEKLHSGDTAVAYLPGHYAAIVSHSRVRDKFLLLDSHKIAARGTSEWGNWVSKEDLSTGKLQVQTFYFFKRLRDFD